MMAALKEKRSQISKDEESRGAHEHVDAAHSTGRDRELDRLMHSAPQRFQSSLNLTVPSESASAQREIGLQDLMNREIQALDVTMDRGSHHAPHGLTSPPTTCAFPEHTPEWYRVVNARQTVKISKLEEELASMDIALQQACKENLALTREKAACKAAHERDVTVLESMLKTKESMLKSVMSENAKLEHALGVAKTQVPIKLAPQVLSHELERSMISSLVQSGISPFPTSANSERSSSEPEGEEPTLDLSRASLDETRPATPSPPPSP